jgi:hypothetical protein
VTTTKPVVDVADAKKAAIEPAAQTPVTGASSAAVDLKATAPVHVVGPVTPSNEMKPNGATGTAPAPVVEQPKAAPKEMGPAAEKEVETDADDDAVIVNAADVPEAPIG